MLLVVGILIIVTIIPSFKMAFAASSDSASIQAADSAINQAFKNVLAAEKTGGNVTQLLTNLNNAVELLSEANNAYQSGDTNGVSSNADNARSIANQVNSDALTLQNVSISQSHNRFLFTIIFSIASPLIYVVIFLVGWRRFKRGYNKRLLALKPKVVNNGA